LKFAFSRLISLNFASLLDKISAQQASKNTSTEAHTHQNIKTPKQTPKQKKTINTPIPRSIQSIQTQPHNSLIYIDSSLTIETGFYSTKHYSAILLKTKHPGQISKELTSLHFNQISICAVYAKLVTNSHFSTDLAEFESFFLN
jgi:hypothetical protein